jgi:glycerol kinase
MSANDWMAQDLADMLGLPVERPDMVETTALGAGVLAAVGAGLFDSLEDAVGAMRGAVRTFTPAMDQATRAERLTRWSRALAAV